MMLFNVLINFIEAFIFPVYLSYYFELDRKKSFILISGTVQLIILNFFTYINKSNYILTLLIVLINFLSIVIVFKTINFNNIFIILSYNFIIIITSYIGLILGNFVFDSFSLILSSEYKIVVICIIAKLLLFILTPLLLKFKINADSDIKFSSWSPLALFQGIYF